MRTCGDRSRQEGRNEERERGEVGGGGCTTCCLSPSFRLEPFMYSFFGRTSSCSWQSLKTGLGVCVCVCVFITAVPITKLFAWGVGLEAFE